MNNDFDTMENICNELFDRYPKLNSCRNSIENSFYILVKSIKNGGTVYIAGNGGSASDSEHIVGELMKSFNSKRTVSSVLANALRRYGSLGEKLATSLEGGIPAISLPSLTSLSTAIINDTQAENIYAQMLVGLGKTNDVFWAISTSGNSQNIIRAALVAKAKGMKVIGMCGQKLSLLDQYSDVVIHVPEIETYKIQELHLPIYHTICAMLESNFFSQSDEIEVSKLCI